MIQCLNCQQPYPENGAPFRCPTCGGLYDFTVLPVYDPAQVDLSQPGLWRYQHALGLPEAAPQVTLGEGNTPLVWASLLGHRVAFKVEGQNPSGSFKDRGSAAIVSFLRARGVQAAVEDSSGNAGASFAAYAARAGLQAQVFVPESASGPKREQIEAYGAQVEAVAGPRSNAAQAVLRAAEQGAIYASHAYLPFNLPGYATLSYELVDQLGGAPGTLLLPAGQGGLLLGAARGFAALKQAGVISQVPRLYGVQARACAPLWALSQYGYEGLNWVSEGPTLAEGVRVRFPLRGDAVLRAVEESGGGFLAVDEDHVLPGRNELAHRGLYVEPTSALVWDGLAQILQPGEISGGAQQVELREPVVAVLTGSGLKYIP